MNREEKRIKCPHCNKVVILLYTPSCKISHDFKLLKSVKDILFAVEQDELWGTKR